MTVPIILWERRGWVWCSARLVGGKGDGQPKKERDLDRQTGRQAGRQADRQADRQTDQLAERERYDSRDCAAGGWKESLKALREAL